LKHSPFEVHHGIEAVVARDVFAAILRQPRENIGDGRQRVSLLGYHSRYCVQEKQA
jgi:hypothetical protein